MSTRRTPETLAEPDGATTADGLASKAAASAELSAVLTGRLLHADEAAPAVAGERTRTSARASPPPGRWRMRTTPCYRPPRRTTEVARLVLGDLLQERHEVRDEVVPGERGDGVDVRIGRRAVEQCEVLARDARLAREDLRRRQHARTPESCAERVDPEVLRQVVAVDRVHVQDALRRVGVAVGDRARVVGQPLRVIP